MCVVLCAQDKRPQHGMNINGANVSKEMRVMGHDTQPGKNQAKYVYMLLYKNTYVHTSFCTEICSVSPRTKKLL